MSQPIGNDDGTGFTALGLSTAISDSTRQGTEIVLERPLSHWSVTSLSDSTGNTLTLTGWASTSTAAVGFQILQTTSPGTAVSTEPYAMKMVRLDVDGVSSSGGVEAYVTGAP